MVKQVDRGHIFSALNHLFTSFLEVHFEEPEPSINGNSVAESVAESTTEPEPESEPEAPSVSEGKMLMLLFLFIKTRRTNHSMIIIFSNHPDSAQSIIFLDRLNYTRDQK